MSIRSGSVFALLLAATAAPRAMATSVEPMNVAALADYAACVMTGEVIEVRSSWMGRPPTIESQVAFENVAFLKGAPTAENDTFAFAAPGGTIDGLEMRLAGAPSFAPGDRWVLFVLPRWQTHPVVGVWRGAFKITTGADGVDRVYQEGLPVLGFDAQGFVRLGGPGEHTAQPRKTTRRRRETGPRTRVRLVEPAATPAMRLEDFLAQIEPVLAASNNHGLAEPAGQRVPVELRPVPLRAAGEGASR